MADKEIAVKVQSLTKSFKIPLEASSGIKQKLINTLKGRKGYREFTPLNDISFEIEKGDFFGIVGRNGSGKSTLLKTIAGIYAPEKGLVRVNGKLVPFIELGVGFNPELTGRENVYLNGALLGFSHNEMEAMYEEIVDFAEIGEFMEEKLKNYSSGMQVRLAFSIAIKAEGDILLLDEVLAVGDEAFQRKCYAYFEDLKRNRKTVIIVTHDMGAVERFCNKAMLIEHGQVIESGDPTVVSHSYTRLFSKETKKVTSEKSDRKRWGTKELEIVNIEPHQVKDGDKKIYIDITIKRNEPIKKKVILAYTIKSKDRRSLFGESGIISKTDFIESQKGIYTIAFSNLLSQGDYYIDLSLRFYDDEEYIDFWIDADRFFVDIESVNGLNILANTTVTKAKNVEQPQK